MDITFTIPANKLQRVIDAINRQFTPPTIPDPNWTYSEEDPLEPRIPEFTDNQWAKEAIRRYLIALDERKRIADGDVAKNDIQKDNSLIT